MKIAIVGGGFTGLTAAYELSKLGHQITIYEKSSELGGLASGFKMHGESLEKTYHHIFRTDTDIISLAEELGLSEKLEWRNSSVCIYYNGKTYPFGGAKDLLFFKPMSFLARIRQGLVIFYLQKDKNWKKFIKKRAFNWMKFYSGQEAMNVIWEPLLKGKFDKYYDKVSMAWLWARLHIRANSRKFLEGEKLGYFNGGFQIIISELQKKLLERKVSINLNSQIIRIKSAVKEKVQITLKVDDNNQKTEMFDKVICTIPSHTFAHLINENKEITQDYIGQLNSINYIGAICLVFSSEQNLSNYYWHNINDLDAPFLAFIHHTKLIPKERYDGKFVYYIGAYLPHESEDFSLPEEELITKWFDYLKKIFPEFDSSKVISKNLFHLRNAQHIVDLDYETKIPDFKTPIPNLYLSNFSQIFPEDRGTNFAVRDGRRIANSIIR